MEILIEQAVIPGAGADFWESDTNHVLCPPGRDQESASAIGALNRHGNEGRVLFATSGTSGIPRWVVLRKSAILASAASVNEWLGLTESDRFLCVLPRFHVAGAGMLARAHLLDAEVWVVEGKWNPVEFRKICERMEISVTSLVPTQLWDIVHRGLRAPDSMEMMVIGGGVLDPVVASEARQLGWPVLASFGMTESASQIATETCRRKLSGWCVEGWLPVIDGWEVKCGGNEQLLIRGPGLLDGYWQESESGEWEMEECVDADGWFASSDLAEVEHDLCGRQWLKPLGRMDDKVKILGELVSLISVRKELSGIARGCGIEPEKCFVIDVPDERKGVRLVLAAESGEWDVHLPNVLDIFNGRVPGFARLDGVRLVPNLPRGKMGKVLRAELRRSCLEAEG